MSTKKQILYEKLEQYKSEVSHIIGMSDLSLLFNSDNLANVVILVKQYFSDSNLYEHTIETFLQYYGIEIDDQHKETFIDKTIGIISFIKNI